MPVVMQRKLYNTMGCAGAALGLGLLAVTRCDVVMAAASLCMVMAFLAFNIPGCFVSPESEVTTYYHALSLPAAKHAGQWIHLHFP